LVPCSFLTLWNLDFKHQQKIFSVFGGHIIKCNFSSAKGVVGVSFFEMPQCPTSFSFFPSRYHRKQMKKIIFCQCIMLGYDLRVGVTKSWSEAQAVHNIPDRWRLKQFNINLFGFWSHNYVLYDLVTFPQILQNSCW